ISESRREALARARSSDGPAMTSPIQLLDETAGFIIFVPVRERLKFVGTLGAVFQTETWLSSLISDIPQRSEQIPFVRQIRLAGDVIYQSDGWTDAEGSRTISAPPVDLFGQTLDVALRRQPGAGLTTRDRRPEIVAFFLVCIGIAVAGIIASMQVATDARNWALAANQNLNAANRTLAEEIEVRREAETRALEASEAKSRFLATMSHEVRTPINAIMGMFELIQAAGVPERQRRQASVGRAAAERLLDQLTAVLEMSKLRAKAVTFNPHEINLQDLAEQWAVTLEGMVRRQERDLDFDVVQGPDLPQKLFVDDKRIHQIVTNLLDNAVKYTSEGRVELRITNATSEDGAAGVALDVVDTGPGIKASQMDRIFDRFVQIDDNIDRASGGAGLGLAIAKELAEAMGMSLALHESGTEGSTFRLFVKTT
ncbi:MAG: ATP-binding protein, partial [Pseudomonadota bacterium]